MLTLFGETASSAVFSNCGAYRYSLTRRWDEGRACCFVLLNPSTADAHRNDPTVRRCLAYSRAWGFPALVVVNLFALRATDPEEMKRHPVPVGPENDRHLLEEAQAAGKVVCAWGNDGAHQGRSQAVGRALVNAGIETYALRVTGQMEPAHPLYLPKDLLPRLWTPGQPEGRTKGAWR